MIYFAGIGILLVFVIISLVLYVLISLFISGKGTLSEDSHVFLTAFIVFSIMIGLIFTLFVLRPNWFGYKYVGFGAVESEVIQNNADKD